MNGYNVFFPIGFDAFGLPAENAAIKNGIHPPGGRTPTSSACAPIARMGAMWAWEREAVTCDPEYYKWTQWFFRKFYDAGPGLSRVRAGRLVPDCNTTLAREQVWGDDRHCERCGTPVIKKELKQWKFRITRYADELVDMLEQIDWPERVKVMQTNWIGRSEGRRGPFHTEQRRPLVIFTTRPDTLWGATFMVLAPEHPLVDAITTDAQRAEVEAYKAAGGAHGRNPARRGRQREDRRLHRRLRHQPGQRRAHSDLDCRLRDDGLWHRRDHGRAGARQRDFRLCPEVRPGDSPRHHRPDGDRRAGRKPTPKTRRAR
jgi:leucyl-tRNA synthetase